MQVDKIGQECIAAGHGYLYKNSLPIGFLSLVDDIIGVTAPGIEAQMMNAFMNEKTAEKTLRFGSKKCKSMLVGKNTSSTINSDLYVDKWDIRYSDTGHEDIIETYVGQIPIGKTDE